MEYSPTTYPATYTYFVGSGDYIFYSLNYTTTSKTCIDEYFFLSSSIISGTNTSSFYTYGVLTKNAIVVSTTDSRNAGTYGIRLTTALYYGPTYNFDITLTIKINSAAP